MTARFRAEQTLPGTPQQIATACVTALSLCRFPITGSDIAQGWIRARAPMGMRSWGENITINVRADGHVEILSRCRLPTQIIDWGKNKANVTEVFSMLHGALGLPSRTATGHQSPRPGDPEPDPANRYG